MWTGAATVRRSNPEFVSWTRPVRVGIGVGTTHQAFSDLFLTKLATRSSPFSRAHLAKVTSTAPLAKA